MWNCLRSCLCFPTAPFVFDNPLLAGEAPTGTANPRGNSTDDLFLGLTMQSQWISFAVHLDPNFHGGEDSIIQLQPRQVIHLNSG